MTTWRCTAITYVICLANDPARLALRNSELPCPPPCPQVKDAKESISINERALAELVNTGATLRQHQATLQDKFQRQEAQVGKWQRQKIRHRQATGTGRQLG